jgi:diguanylate cyclase (GGDEF)-like protein
VLVAGRFLPFPGPPGCRAIAVEAAATRSTLVAAARDAGCDPALVETAAGAPVLVALCDSGPGGGGRGPAWMAAAQMAMAAEEEGLSALILPQTCAAPIPPDLGLPTDWRLEALLALGPSGPAAGGEAARQPEPVEAYLAASPPPGMTPGTGDDRDLLLSFMEIASASAGAEDLDGMLETIARALARLFPVDGAAVALLEEDGLLLREILRRGEALRRDAERRPADPSHHLGWVIAGGRPLWRNDVSSELRFAESFPDDGMRSDMTIPLRARGRITGAFRVACRRRHAFDTGDFDMLQRCADLTSIAVETQRLLLATRRLSEVDGLTGVFNHRQFITLLEQEIESARRTDRPVALLMIDVDDFKGFNDAHGHQVGDEVLRHVAQLVARLLRRSDTVARYGGEEFAVILQDSTGEAAEAVGETLRKEVESRPLGRSPEAGSLSVRISLGVASYPVDAFGAADLVSAADRALYQAKRAGKNRVVRLSR